MNAKERAGGEVDAPDSTRDREPVADVLSHLPPTQRVQVVAGGNPLSKLTEIALGEQIVQLRLPDEHDLYELLGGGLQIGDEPHLLQHIPGKVLRLVDDENRVLALCARTKQKLVKLVDEILIGLLVGGIAGDPEVAIHRAKKLRRAECGIENERG